MRLVLALICFACPAVAQGPFAFFDKASDPVLNQPGDLAFGPDGLLYITDKIGGQVVVMDPETLEVSHSFGQGRLSGVQDISFGPDGHALVAVTGASSLATFDISGEPSLVGALVGFAQADGALAHSNGRRYVMVGDAGVLVALDDADQPVAMASGHTGAFDVAEAPDGSIWLADPSRRRLVRYSPDLERLQVLDDPALGLQGARFLDIDPWGRLVVANQASNRILLINPETGVLLGTLGDGRAGLGPDTFGHPDGVAVRGATYFVSDSDNNRIVRYVIGMN